MSCKVGNWSFWGSGGYDGSWCLPWEFVEYGFVCCGSEGCCGGLPASAAVDMLEVVAGTVRKLCKSLLSPPYVIRSC